MPVDMVKLLAYCRVTDEGDPTLLLCYNAAVAYVAGAGVKPPVDDADGNPAPAAALYELLVYMLTLAWYDARGTAVIGAVPAPLERTAQALILQLRGGG